MQILHVINSLEIGGTELFLERLLRSQDGEEFKQVVVSFTDVGVVGESMQRDGVRVHALQSGWHPGEAVKLLGLRQIVRDSRPDLVQGWIYRGNVEAYAATRISGIRCPIIWNIRHSLDNWENETMRLRALIRIGGWLAGAPQRIVFNSSRSARQHERLGYPRAKACMIPNGFDLQRFALNTASRTAIRAQLAIGDDLVVLGTIGRYHPLKDHANFLRAARLVADSHPQARFVLAGKQLTAGNRSLMNLVRQLQLEDRVMLLGERDDIPDILNAFDIHVSSSSSEAFPNAVGEAMCCQVPCVVTDVGASAEVVADTGIVVPPKASELLAQGMRQLIEAGAVHRNRLGTAARERMRLNYSNHKVAQQYADLYRSVLR